MLQPLIEQNKVVVYIDDIMIASDSVETNSKTRGNLVDFEKIQLRVKL